MNKGTLSFALNGEFFGVAFTDAKLTNGPIFPAVSLLHQAGCTIKSGLQVPSKIDFFLLRTFPEWLTNKIILFEN